MASVVLVLLLHLSARQEAGEKQKQENILHAEPLHCTTVDLPLEKYIFAHMYTDIYMAMVNGRATVFFQQPFSGNFTFVKVFENLKALPPPVIDTIFDFFLQ